MTTEKNPGAPWDTDELLDELRQLEKTSLLTIGQQVPRMAGALVAVIRRLEARIVRLEESSNGKESNP